MNQFDRGVKPYEARAIRLRLGMTQHEMGRALRCTASFVNGMESGYYFISEERKEYYRTIKRLGEIALARRAKLDWSL